MSEECLFECNERSTVVLAVTFADENGDPVTPDSATYRIDDRQRRTNLFTATAFPSLGASVDLEIHSDYNRILRSRSDYEIRTVTVEFDYDGGSKHGTAEYRYKVINLYGVVTVPSASVSPSASASPSV